jgi:hypothetical protein
VHVGLDTLPEAIRQELAAADDEGNLGSDVLDRVVEQLLVPAVAVNGADVVLNHLLLRRSDPYIAAVLVDACGEGGFRLAEHGRSVTRVTDIYSDNEIVSAALDYLLAMPDAGFADGQWAWTALWNGWSQLEPEDHFRLVMELVERLPQDDALDAMVADGPLRSLTEDPEARARLLARAEKDPKLARLLALM